MSSVRPRVLIVTRNLPPLVGGMERLNWHMAEELAKRFDVRMVGPEDSASYAPAGIETREAPLRPLWKFLLRARQLARKEARRWRPDIVLAGSGLTAPLARSAARICGARVAVYAHGLDVAVKHLIYRAVWLRAIRGMDRVIANSNATAGLCCDIGVDPARIGIVHPGVDIPTDVEPLSARESDRGEGPDFEPLSLRENGRGKGSDFEPLFRAERGRGEDSVPRDTAESVYPGGNPHVTPPSEQRGAREARGNVAFRQRHQLGNRPILLSVGRLSARKGLREFVERCLPRIAAAHPDVLLLIVGDAPKDALHAEAQTPESIRTAAARAGVADNLRFLGTITDYAELGALYRAADVHVFPVREIAGDPEGFGMVAVEAASHGLPTVAFATGGVIDAVAEGESGTLVAPGDYPAFADATLATLAGRDVLHQPCIAFGRRFAWSAFGEQVAAQLAMMKSLPATARSRS